ncbi:phosphotransferase enzyme family protein [archaeon BMS3Bbin16]|nr:phosphotransferase enzyme family protein [archaeon BMS3Bbin16]
MPDSIVEVVEALKNPDVYPEKVTVVEIVQTHISYVFLTDEFVYKVKKHVDFGFLDFTTLEKRRHFCKEEIRRNTPLCKDMYLGVVPINRDGAGKISVDDGGEAIEYAVKMRRMPDDAIMTRLLERNSVTPEHVDRIARLLSDFHRNADTGSGVDEYGSLSQVRENWVQNFEQTQAHRGGLINPSDFDYIEKKVTEFMEKNEGLFNKRVSNGRVRECHGDVHSGNIFILPDSRIYIFDAIEFFKGFSCSDVASEVAFLAMDLEFQNRADLAEGFVEKYVEYSGDTGLLELLDFYKCYRAYVRAKVNSFRLFEPEISESDRDDTEKIVSAYFKLAHRYASRL